MVSYWELLKSPYSLALIILANVLVTLWTLSIAIYNGGSVLVHVNRVWGWWEAGLDVLTMLFYLIIALAVLWDESEAVQWLKDRFVKKVAQNG